MKLINKIIDSIKLLDDIKRGNCIVLYVRDVDALVLCAEKIKHDWDKLMNDAKWLKEQDFFQQSEDGYMEKNYRLSTINDVGDKIAKTRIDIVD